MLPAAVADRRPAEHSESSAGQTEIQRIKKVGLNGLNRNMGGGGGRWVKLNVIGFFLLGGGGGVGE